LARLKKGPGKASARRSSGGGRSAGQAGGRKLARRGGGATLRLMGSLLKAAVLLGALAAVCLLLPIHGHTLAERWRAAGSPAAFGERLWAELRGEPPATRPRNRKGPAGSAGRTDEPRTDEARTDGDEPASPRTDAGRTDAGRSGAGPTERHTDADRQALDRLLGDHLADPPKR
jgi:hypothetical protein